MRISDLFVPKKTAMLMKQLYAGKEADRRIRRLGREKALLSAVILSVSVVLSVPVFIMDHKETLEPVTELARSEYGMGTGAVTLTASMEDGYEEKIKIDINERTYTDEEIERFSQRLDDELWTDILGDNPDDEHIVYDLDLPKCIEGYPFNISWKTDDPLILSSSGKINEKKLKSADQDDEGTAVRLCATLKYKDYVEDKYGYVILHQRNDAKDAPEAAIAEAVSDSDSASSSSMMQSLPSSVGGREIFFYKTDPGRGWAILFMGVAAAVFASLHKDETIRSQAEQRNKQMEADYPKIINQYALYYTAGMNPRTIWSAICDRYEKDRDMNNEKRYAYEEMILTRRMMEEGTEELAAYDRFAKRCQTVGLRSFISMIRQTVTKGNDGLDRMLVEEMEKSFRSRINAVKIAASDAQTKLLFPMLLMLAVVLAIVMIPAFIGMNV